MSNIRRKYLALTMAVAMMLSTTMQGCQTQGETAQSGETAQAEETAQLEESSDVSVSMDAVGAGIADTRAMIMNAEALASVPEYTANVPSYQTAADLSNVINKDQFYMQEQTMNVLAANNFVVLDGQYSEFFDVYENNRYNQYPSFVTTDSIMHTYHLYFSMLQKSTELNYLSADLSEMSTVMLEHSKAQYEELVGSEWEEAARKNVIFFSVGASLQNPDTSIPDYVKADVENELTLIMQAQEVANSSVTGGPEDYSQYKPRGYYEGDETLESYFRAMMWYGRMNFKQADETMNRCALLMTLALTDEAATNWEEIYTITSFFAGTSDDSGPYEYLPMIREAYGDAVQCSSLIGNTEDFTTYQQLIAQLAPPLVNSVVVMDDGGDTVKTDENKGYRLMGQRFTIDAEIFTQLCYSVVTPKEDGTKRMIPNALDIPAALGSDTALQLLVEEGNYEYPNYETNMMTLREEISSAPNTLWTGSLYGGWLYTLTPLLEVRGEGYPAFMQSEVWRLKNLESFLGSFTELKHDTVLYSKQFVAECGGGDMETIDDRGYVEPEVEVYAYLAALSKNTSEGLQNFGIIADTDIENLELLSTMCDSLMNISIKELEGTALTEEEYELIRNYGGSLEHFWRETIDSDNEYAQSTEYPAAMVVDIATDPNGAVLEQAIGGISTIYVVVMIDGELRIARGGVFNYYEFTQPLNDRLTDSEWRQMIGMELTDDMEYLQNVMEQPAWTQGYRTANIYETY